jgi:cytochrome c oxidase subunit III
MAPILDDFLTVQKPPPDLPDKTADIDNGGSDDRIPAAPVGRRLTDYSPPPASTAIWVVIAAITMTFAALTSALIVRQSSSVDWRHLTLPRILYANTLVLFLSSITLEVARHGLMASKSAGKRQPDQRDRWLYITLFLGLLFVGGQWVAWMQLRAQGLYLATNPNSSFFYVLTVAHALHILGGLCGLAYVTRKLNRGMLRKSTLDAAARYWHFVDLLWIYLLMLLWVKV